MKKVVAALAAFLLPAGGSMLAVYLVSRDPGPPSAPPPSPPPEAVAAAPATPSGIPGPDLARMGVGTGGMPAPPPAYGPPPPEPPPGTWEAVQPAARLGRLGPLGAALNVRLNALQPRISSCFDQAAARGGHIAASDNYTETRDYGQVQDTGTTILMLQVETLAGAARIVDAPVEAAGAASPGAIGCVQGLLRGQVVPVPGATAGQRHRVLHPLLQ